MNFSSIIIICFNNNKKYIVKKLLRISNRFGKTSTLFSMCNTIHVAKSISWYIRLIKLIRGSKVLNSNTQVNLNLVKGMYKILDYNFPNLGGQLGQILLTFLLETRIIDPFVFLRWRLLHFVKHTVEMAENDHNLKKKIRNYCKHHKIYQKRPPKLVLIHWVITQFPPGNVLLEV